MSLAWFRNVLPPRNRTQIDSSMLLSQLENDGVVIIPSAISSRLCDAINLDFDRYVAKNFEVASSFLLESGNHSRLCNLHTLSTHAQEAIVSSSIRKVILSFFGGDFYIASSLYFEESSRQAIHRDTPFFYGHPRATFLGVWFALEDVRLDAGPLTYYPGGHRLVLETRGERSASVNDAWQGYCDRLLNACVAAGIERQQALVKKGTCVIWHPELPHGGSEISRPGATRRSIVFHCAPTDVTLYGVDEFFGFKPIFPKENHIIKNKTGGLMIDQGPPSFAQNG